MTEVLISGRTGDFDEGAQANNLADLVQRHSDILARLMVDRTALDADSIVVPSLRDQTTSPTVAPVSAPEPAVEFIPVQSSVFERAARLLSTSISGMGAEFRSVRQNIVDRASHRIAEARTRIIEATMTKKAKIERAVGRTSPVLDDSIATVPTPFSLEAQQDKLANLETWITSEARTVKGKTKIHYSLTEEGQALVTSVAEASGATTVRTRAEFDVVCASLNQTLADQKAKIEAERADAPVASPAVDARAASQLELAKRVTSRARLQALISLKSAERAHVMTPEQASNRAHAEAILSEIYAEIGIDRMPFTPDASNKLPLWRQVSDEINLRYKSIITTLEVEAVIDGVDFATQMHIKKQLMSQAQKACATARLMAWNQMTRPQPAVEIEVVEAVEAAEEIVATSVVPHDGVPEEAPTDIAVVEPAIPPSRARAFDRIRAQWNNLSRTEKAMAVIAGTAVLGIAGSALQIASNSARISGAQAEEAALAAQHADSSAVLSLSELPVYLEAPVVAPSVTATERPITSSSPLNNLRSRLRGNGIAPAVQTLQAGAAVHRQQAEATETAEPEKSPRIKYEQGKPVKVTVTCGDTVIPFTMTGPDGNPQDVKYDLFGSQGDIPQDYDMDEFTAVRFNSGSIVASGLHSELDGVEANAGAFQNYVVRNGGPKILPGCRVEAEADGIIEGFTIIQALEVPVYIKDTVTGEMRGTNIDDMLERIQVARQAARDKHFAETGEELIQPAIDEIGYTCYRFANRETTQFLVWVLTRTDARIKNQTEDAESSGEVEVESMLPIASPVADANLSRNPFKNAQLQPWQQRAIRSAQLAGRKV